MKLFKLIIISLLFINLSALAIELTKEEKVYLKNNSKFKVGVGYTAPYGYFENGEAKGFSIDLLNKIAEKLDIELEFIHLPLAKSWEAIKNNEIQVMANLIQKEKRKKHVYYGDAWLLFKDRIFVKKEDYLLNSLEKLNGKTVAITKNYALNDILTQEYPKIKLVYAKNKLDMLNMVSKGEADATIYEENAGLHKIGKNAFYNLTISGNANFKIEKTMKANYFVVGKNHTILHNILNKTYNSLEQSELVELWREWFFEIPEYKKYSLTNEEKEYLKQKPYLSVMSLKNFQPFNFIKDNKHMGYSVDTIKLLSEQIGKEIKFINKPWGEQLNMLKNGKLDIIPHIAVTKERKNFVDYTDFTHITFSVGFAINKEDGLSSIDNLKGKTLAVVNKYYLHNYIKKTFPDIKLLLTSSTKEAVEAVANGKAFAVIDNVATLNYFIQAKWLSNLKISTVNDLKMSTQTQMPMGVTKGNKVLKSILEKANASLDSEKVMNLKKKWLSAENISVSLTKKEKKYLSNKRVLYVPNLKTFAPFNFNDNGVPKGYSIDYLNLMAKYMGVDIKFVGNKTWSEYLLMLKEGNLDIIPHIAENEERKMFVEFTDFEHITYTTGIAVKKDNTIDSMYNLKDKVIAVANNTFLHKYLQDKFPKQKLLLTESSSEALEIVSLGRADAALGSIPSLRFFIEKSRLNNIKIVNIKDLGLSLETKMPMGVAKNNKILKSILEKVNDSIPYSEVIKLREKWMNMKPFDKKVTFLTKEETEYLELKKELKMCVLPNWLPFEQIDENGKHKGIGSDIMNIVSERIGIPIILNPTNVWAESLQNIRDRKCDILPVAMDIPSRKDAMNFTEPYVKEPFVIATTNDKFFIRDINDLSNKKIGVVKSYAFIEVLKTKNPLIKIVEVSNSKEGLEKVSNGDLYGYIDTMPTIGYFIQKHGFFNLKIAGKLSSTINLSIASRNDEPMLNEILEKALNTISEEEVRKIVGRWIEIKVHQEFDYEKLFYIVGVFLIIVFIILYKNRVVNKANKKLIEQQNMIDNYVMIITTDLKGIITDVNSAYCNKIGFTKEELIGFSHKSIRHKDMSKEIFVELWKDISNNKTWHGEMKNVTKHGETLYINIVIEPQFNEGKKIGYRAICEDITNRKIIEKLSITDTLTGLFNRLKLDKLLDEQKKLFDRYKTPFSVILLDIDNFKSINDTYGHDIGDIVLKVLADNLKIHTRETDFIGRWGGEEFLIICKNTNGDNACLLAEKVRQNIENIIFEECRQQTVSLGVAEYNNDTLKNLFKRVDNCLYEAKKLGKNQVKYYKN